MVAVIGFARPDCDWCDKGSTRGCREMAQFRVGLKGPHGEFKKHSIHGCRSHAPRFVKEILQPLQASFRRQGQNTIITIVDITLESRAAMSLIKSKV